MVYGFEFQLNGLVYYESGSKTKEKAKLKLEEISRIWCEKNDSAIGIIYEVRNGFSEVLEKYEIKINKKRIIL